MQNQRNESCFSRMLDIRTFIIGARNMMAQTDASQAVVLIVIFGLIGLCLSPLYVAYDLHSTWAWANPIKEAAAPTVSAMEAQIDQHVPQSAKIADMTIGQLVGALVLVGITVLPSLFELGFPSMRHPLLMLLLTAAILFDYVTDWATSWAATAGWSGAGNWFVHFLWTAFVFNPFMSVGVQALIVVCITVVTFGFIRLVRGGSGPALGEAVIISK